MLEEKKNKLKEMFSSFKTKGNDKKKIENLVVFVIILIITIILINTIWNSDEKTEGNKQINSDKILAKTDNTNAQNSNLETDELEVKLENILENIEGVGKVKVLLTYSESSQTIAMYNEDTTESDTEETDTRRRK